MREGITEKTIKELFIFIIYYLLLITYYLILSSGYLLPSTCAEAKAWEKVRIRLISNNNNK